MHLPSPVSLTGFGLAILLVLSLPGRERILLWLSLGAGVALAGRAALWLRRHADRTWALAVAAGLAGTLGAAPWPIGGVGDAAAIVAVALLATHLRSPHRREGARAGERLDIAIAATALSLSLFHVLAGAALSGGAMMTSARLLLAAAATLATWLCWQTVLAVGKARQRHWELAVVLSVLAAAAGVEAVQPLLGLDAVVPLLLRALALAGLVVLCWQPGGLPVLEPREALGPGWVVVLAPVTLAPILALGWAPDLSPVQRWLTVAAVVILVAMVTWRAVTAVADRARSRRDLRRRATHDPLTGLPNRRSAEADIEARRVADVPVAALFFDLDGFKRVNDTFGHAAGDELLRQIGERLRSSLRADDLVCRQGGDEFVVVVSGDQAQAHRVAERVREQFATPFTVDDFSVAVTPSIGLAVQDGPEVDASELLARADAAMYVAKRRGRDQLAVHDAEERAGDDAVALAVTLQQALDAGEVGTELVPLRRTDDAGLWGREAVPVCPGVQGDVADLARRTGAASRLASVVLDEALAACAASDADALPRVVVGVTAEQFSLEDYPRLLWSSCDRHGVEPSRLALAVPELAVAATGTAETVADRLARLHDHGVTVLVDDIGTGYASLLTLAGLDVDGIVLPARFVGRLGQRRQDGVDMSAAIVDALATTGADLGLVVLARGADGPATTSRLAAVGVTAARPAAV